jgi:hypothetical protein
MNWTGMTPEEVLNYAPAEAKTPLELALLGMVEDAAKEAQDLREQVNEWEICGDESSSLRDELDEVKQTVRDILENDNTDSEKLEAISEFIA